MALQQLLNDEVAGVGSVALVGAFAAWKLWLRIKKDSRDDRGSDEMQKGYSSLLDEVQETVQRQGEIIDRLSERLDRAEERRRSVEDENAQLRRRVAHLEDEVRENTELRARVAHLEDEVRRLRANEKSGGGLA